MRRENSDRFQGGETLEDPILVGPVRDNTSLIVHSERNSTISKEHAGIATVFCDD